MGQLELPDPTAPTSHPFFERSYRPNLHNIFSVMPARNLNDFAVGDTVPLNIANYLDPWSELDYHRLVASKPRWQQGLLVRLENIQGIQADFSSSFRDRTIKPADKVFSGHVLNHGVELPVAGVLHPVIAGWLAFDTDALGAELRTIADLKAHIGQIGAEQAVEHANTLHYYGTFKVNGTTFS